MAEFFLGAALAGLLFLYMGVMVTSESIEKVLSTCEQNEGVKHFGVDHFESATVQCNSGAIFKIDLKDRKSK
ncbi:hypothetical protein QE331_gp001 [Pseudomonas phage 20Sep416]|uniref:Uncharacterized protein n=1 Tax=Pseudomonas phage 20Sep416 TaxID=3028488 RepID=A0AAF0JPP4_9CAUD|nr:hypothetical protein QE331_gp001 [Pseudomonas phage 20Sep416]WFG37125.1 hypothetical protein 9081_00010 [Pseudomonas phage bmx-p3]WFG37496.1 hypothetical protein 20Sep416_00001 [Pseudomonas phage 20Sep416]